MQNCQKMNKANKVSVSMLLKAKLTDKKEWLMI